MIIVPSVYSLAFDGFPLVQAEAEAFGAQEQQVLAQQERFRAQHALAAIDRSFQKAENDARTTELLRLDNSRRLENARAA